MGHQISHTVVGELLRSLKLSLQANRKTRMGNRHRLSGSFDLVVITSAALPWRTGPALIGLWHACGLARPGRRVAFGFPWLTPADQERLWGRPRFATPDEQIEWMAEEARRLGCPGQPEMFWYRARFSASFRSVIPNEDAMAVMPETRILVLEEPEHLCWHPGIRRRSRIRAEFVIGIIMTNYPYYVRHARLPGAAILAWMVERFHALVIRTRTDLAVPISLVVPMPNLRHPVRHAMVTGALPAYATVPPVGPDTMGVYFLGRLVWEKGVRTVIETAQRMNLAIDLLGDGPDRPAMEALAQTIGAPVRFLGPTASPWTELAPYRVFFNPSLSETLCTTIIEALVAGRHVVVPVCEANRPFLDYPNVHAYHDADGAVIALGRALATVPVAPDAARQELTWPAACRRLAALWGEEVAF